jgi:hypothetical protein
MAINLMLLITFAGRYKIAHRSLIDKHTPRNDRHLHSKDVQQQQQQDNKEKRLPMHSRKRSGRILTHSFNFLSNSYVRGVTVCVNVDIFPSHTNIFADDRQFYSINKLSSTRSTRKKRVCLLTTPSESAQFSSSLLSRSTHTPHSKYYFPMMSEDSESEIEEAEDDGGRGKILSSKKAQNRIALSARK